MQVLHKCFFICAISGIPLLSSLHQADAAGAKSLIIHFNGSGVDFEASDNICKSIRAHIERGKNTDTNLTTGFVGYNVQDRCDPNNEKVFFGFGQVLPQVLKGQVTPGATIEIALSADTLTPDFSRSF